MKKIGIVTLNGYFNYGNRLQNYALQEVLKAHGLTVQTIRFARETKIKKYFTFLKIIKRNLVNRTNYILESERQKIFLSFSNNYIVETDKIYYIDENLDCINSEYDFLVVGSDQVWNPSMNKESSVFFLEFADKEKRIAYAPSFGVSELPDRVISDYQKWIKSIPHLSIREDDGAKIIKNLTGREVEVLVDPTLLLTKEKWLNIAKSADNKPNEPYLLTYFLGGIPSKYKEQINKIALVRGLKVINLGDINESDTYRTGPSEFIDYINDCSVFCTDSFHGAVFSILLQKPFIVYEREGAVSMYSRIDTLLNKFDLNDRKCDYIEINKNVFDVDFSHTLPVLKKERQKAINFLRNSLNIKDE